MRIRRALITVSDKSGVVEIGRALSQAGAELVATGKTAQVLIDAGLRVVPIESVSGSPEAFQGRMKTLSFPVCSGILYRRGDASDETDLARLKIQPIDCVVVNFYPFEAAAARDGISERQLIEEIDIGGPTLVRSAAKNSEHVLVLTNPRQYDRVIDELKARGEVSASIMRECALEAWGRITAYDQAISERFGVRPRMKLRYGENPHQQGWLDIDPEGAIAWPCSPEEALSPNELSYNNILDLSSAYALASDLTALGPDASGVVIVKHNNPCGVALVPGTSEDAQFEALQRAWEGDPVSAFGGVLVFTQPLGAKAAAWLSERFVELIAAPRLNRETVGEMLKKRKKLKAVAVRRFGEVPAKSPVNVPGGVLWQTTDTGLNEDLRSVTRAQWPRENERLGRFGIAVCRSLKSNALALVREIPGAGALQLVGAGQGQPNRIDALQRLAVPRALEVLKTVGGALADCVLVSDAFFPFRDTVDAAAEAGLRWIIQPGGSLKDADSIAACDEKGIAMVFTGTRHFKH